MTSYTGSGNRRRSSRAEPIHSTGLSGGTGGMAKYASNGIAAASGGGRMKRGSPVGRGAAGAARRGREPRGPGLHNAALCKGFSLKALGVTVVFSGLGS